MLLAVANWNELSLVVQLLCNGLMTVENALLMSCARPPAPASAAQDLRHLSNNSSRDADRLVIYPDWWRLA